MESEFFSLSFVSSHLSIFLFYSLIFLSQRRQEPGTYGPQRSVRPLREAQTDPRSSEWEQTEDQDHKVLPQPHLERDL